MAAEIVMPRLSDSMEEGTILKWLKSEGDEVELGEELVEIETDKANMVFEADEAGTLIEIVASEGDTLPIGEVIARVGEAGEAGEGGESADEGDEEAETEESDQDEEAEESDDDAEGEDREQQDEAPGEEDGDDERPSTVRGSAASQSPRVHAAEPSSAPSTSPDDESGAESAGEGDGRVKASPLARRIAGEKGLELGSIEGSGPGGRIVKADVERAVETGGVEAGGDGAEPAAPTAPAEAKPPAPSEPTPGAREKPETAKGSAEKVELSKLQQTVARRMAESKATAPHFYLSSEIEMTRAVEGRARLKASAGEDEVVPSFNDMVVKACALALREFPRANGAYRDGALELYSRVNVGVAVAARDALVVPTVFDADLKGLRQIAAETRSLAKRVRDGTVTPPELSGGTFTVSNLGMFGVTDFAAVINPPQAAILAVGAIVEKPVVRDGEIATGHLMGVTLACDHRILYGADGAQFLARVRTLLEEPLALAL